MFCLRAQRRVELLPNHEGERGRRVAAHTGVLREMHGTVDLPVRRAPGHADGVDGESGG